MGRGTDLLLQLALEHRELAQASRVLRQRSRDLTRAALLDAAIRIVEHELAHRLLVHPLLRRDRRGRELFSERREEQLLLADRLRQLLAAMERAPEGGADLPTDPIVRLDQQLTAHTDREEIVSFPHLRRTVEADELAELGGLRGRLRDLLLERFAASEDAITDGSWADAPRRELPRVLDLPEDLVVTLPDLGTEDRTPAS